MQVDVRVKTARQVQRSAQRLFRDCRAGAHVDEVRARRATMALIESHRRRSLDVLSQLARLVRLQHAKYAAVVESASPLPADLRADLEAALARRYGPDLRATFVHSPALIGGVRVAIGSDVFDGSVRARLATLARRFDESVVT